MEMVRLKTSSVVILCIGCSHQRDHIDEHGERVVRNPSLTETFQWTTPKDVIVRVDHCAMQTQVDLCHVLNMLKQRDTHPVRSFVLDSMRVYIAEDWMHDAILERLTHFLSVAPILDLWLYLPMRSRNQTPQPLLDVVFGTRRRTLVLALDTYKVDASVWRFLLDHALANDTGLDTLKVQCTNSFMMGSAFLSVLGEPQWRGLGAQLTHLGLHFGYSQSLVWSVWCDVLPLLDTLREKQLRGLYLTVHFSRQEVMKDSLRHLLPWPAGRKVLEHLKIDFSQGNADVFVLQHLGYRLGPAANVEFVLNLYQLMHGGANVLGLLLIQPGWQRVVLDVVDARKEHGPSDWGMMPCCIHMLMPLVSVRGLDVTVRMHEHETLLRVIHLNDLC